jgi:3,2-trans-enoyl-CoA isomerase
VRGAGRLRASSARREAQDPDGEGDAVDVVQLEPDGHIAHIKLSRGVTNAIDPDTVDADENLTSVILESSNDKFFSIGLDVPFLLELHGAELQAFSETFNRLCMRLYTFPFPTVAAITGHAVAGGCILAMCCDHRVISEGRKLIGVNEVRLALPVPFAADTIMRHELGARSSRIVMETGELYPSEEAFRLGLVDEVVPLEQVRSRAKEYALMMSELPVRAFRMNKRNRTEPVEDHIKKHLHERAKYFVRCWQECAQERLREAAKKFEK